MVALGGVSRDVVDARHDGLAGLERALLEHDHERLVFAQPVYVLDARAAVAALAFDRADIGDLASPGA